MTFEQFVQLFGEEEQSEDVTDEYLLGLGLKKAARA